MRTTKADFEFFVRECRKWIDAFSLNDFEWDFYHEHDEDYIARGSSHYEQRKFEITLSKEVRPHNISLRKELKRSAFHEVCELMVIRLENRAYHRDEKTEMETERHALVYRIYHAVMGEPI